MGVRTRIEVQRAGDATSAPLRLRELLVVDEGGSHLIARAKSNPASGPTFSEGDPVVLMWGLTARPAKSLMYVHRVSDRSVSNQNAASYDLTLVGASWPLKTSVQRAIRGSTAAQVLATIVGDYGLSHEYRAVSRTFDLFVSQGSDWMALKDLAKRVGGMLRVDGTTVRLFDLNEGLSRVDDAPVFTPDSSSLTQMSVTSQRPDSRRREVSMVHPNTKSVVRVDDDLWLDGDDLVLTDHPRVAVGSPIDTQQSLRAVRLSERFREVGVASGLRGDPRLRPGEVIGFRDFTPQKNGYWTVTKSEHSLAENSFVTRLEVGRSSDHPRRAAAHGPIITGPTIMPLAGAALRQDRWVAA